MFNSKLIAYIPYVMVVVRSRNVMNNNLLVNLSINQNEQFCSVITNGQFDRGEWNFVVRLGSVPEIFVVFFDVIIYTGFREQKWQCSSYTFELNYYYFTDIQLCLINFFRLASSEYRIALKTDVTIVTSLTRSCFDDYKESTLVVTVL